MLGCSLGRVAHTVFSNEILVVCAAKPTIPQCTRMDEMEQPSERTARSELITAGR